MSINVTSARQHLQNQIAFLRTELKENSSNHFAITSICGIYCVASDDENRVVASLGKQPTVWTKQRAEQVLKGMQTRKQHPGITWTMMSLTQYANLHLDQMERTLEFMIELEAMEPNK